MAVSQIVLRGVMVTLAMMARLSLEVQLLASSPTNDVRYQDLLTFLSYVLILYPYVSLLSGAPPALLRPRCHDNNNNNIDNDSGHRRIRPHQPRHFGRPIDHYFPHRALIQTQVLPPRGHSRSKLAAVDRRLNQCLVSPRYEHSATANSPA